MLPAKMPNHSQERALRALVAAGGKADRRCVPIHPNVRKVLLSKGYIMETGVERGVRGGVYPIYELTPKGVAFVEEFPIPGSCWWGEFYALMRPLKQGFFTFDLKVLAVLNATIPAWFIFPNLLPTDLTEIVRGKVEIKGQLQRYHDAPLRWHADIWQANHFPTWRDIGVENKE